MAWNIVGGEPIIPIVSSSIPKIAILCPHTSRLSAEFVEQMWTPLKFNVGWCDKAFLQSRAPSLPLARNMLLQKAVEDESITHVLWVDSDMSPHSPSDINTALKVLYDLCEQNPIVSGLYRAKQAHGFNWAMWKYMQGPMCDKCGKGFIGASVGVECPDGCGGTLFDKKGFIHINDWTGNWFEVDVTGLGFCMMKIEVLRDIYKFYMDSKVAMETLKKTLDYDVVKYSDYFTVETPFHWDSEGEMSEDFHMLMLAKRLGYKTFVYSDVLLSHIGELVVEPTKDGATFRTMKV